MLRQIFDDADDHTRAKTGGIYALLIAGNIGAWLWALIEFSDRPLLLGTAFLAYSFGLRHAFDADHIAAIDNVTRKLMQERRRPLAVGFFFSLGHSTIVVALAVAVALTTTTLQDQFDTFKAIGGTIGTSVSALFLFAIAAANMVVLTQVYRAFQAMHRGGAPVEDNIDLLLSKRGFLGRLFRPAFAMIERSWHMYPLGMLFGLGFDTATEVGLLGISVAQAAQSPSIASILVFPALFTAGMSLMDTTDSALMVRAYGWAFVKPMRKLYYNMTITFVSVMTALVVGGIEALGLIGDKLGLQGSFWAFVGLRGGNFGFLGYGIVALFLGSWFVSALVFRARGYDRLRAPAARS
jgi:high-affinity nickel-transport protein